ncbi:MAG TPA: hypothetical protein PKE06_04360 [Flavilitoribacter sp.]|nr:hypothetical protein [Flavilitoribacter sp.]HMQ87382.1 hypothetical protein [Flavilitoribacter sp.]
MQKAAPDNPPPKAPPAFDLTHCYSIAALQKNFNPVSLKGAKELPLRGL